MDENAKASDENAYFGKENDKASDEESDEDEVGSGVLEVSDEEKAGSGVLEVAARPASPATQIRKRVDFIITSQSNLEKVGKDLAFDVAKCIGPLTDDDKPPANVLSPLPYKSCTGMNGRIQLHLATKLAWQSIVANTKEVVEKFMQDTTRAKITLALYCTGGKHRSAASASLLQDVVQHNFPDALVYAQFGFRPWCWYCCCPGVCAEAGTNCHQSLLADREAARMLTRRLWQAA